MGHVPHLLVISKVVPKIWARTNSAMVDCGVYGSATGAGWRTLDKGAWEGCGWKKAGLTWGSREYSELKSTSRLLNTDESYWSR